MQPSHIPNLGIGEGWRLPPLPPMRIYRALGLKALVFPSLFTQKGNLDSITDSFFVLF